MQDAQGRINLNDNLIKALNNSRKTLDSWEYWPGIVSTLKHILIKLLDFKDKEKWKELAQEYKSF